MIVGKDIKKAFGLNQVLNGIDIKINDGQIVGLIGANGSGKTTLLNVLNGLVSTDNGSIKIDNYDITKMPVYVRARMGIASTFQNVKLPISLTAKELYWMKLKKDLLANYPAGKLISCIVYRCIEAIKLISTSMAIYDKNNFIVLQKLFRNKDISKIVNSKISELSSGEQRKLDLASLLANDQKLWLLDEPTASLDEDSIKYLQQLFFKLVKTNHLSIMFAEHNIQFVKETADIVYWLESGKIKACGPTIQIMDSDEFKYQYGNVK